MKDPNVPILPRSTYARSSTPLLLKLFRQCGILKQFRQRGILELFRQCGILELFQQCGILELFRQCGILELFRMRQLQKVDRWLGQAQNETTTES